MKQPTVFDFAKKYGVSSKEIIRELNELGIKTPQAEKSVIQPDMLELAEDYLAELYETDESALNVSDAARKRTENDRRGGAGDDNHP